MDPRRQAQFPCADRPHANDELTKMGVPRLDQYMKDDDSRRVMELIVSQQRFQRPYFVAMGTPEAMWPSTQGVR